MSKIAPLPHFAYLFGPLDSLTMLNHQHRSHHLNRHPQLRDKYPQKEEEEEETKFLTDESVENSFNKNHRTRAFVFAQPGEVGSSSDPRVPLREQCP